MAFKKKTSRAVSTTAVPLGGAGSTPPANKIWVVFGVSLCVKGAQAVAADLFLRDTDGDTYLLSNFTIPAGDTHFPIGALNKMVMGAGDLLYVRSSIATSIDAIMSVTEEDAT